MIKLGLGLLNFVNVYLCAWIICLFMTHYYGYFLHLNLTGIPTDRNHIMGDLQIYIARKPIISTRFFFKAAVSIRAEQLNVAPMQPGQCQTGREYRHKPDAQNERPDLQQTGSPSVLHPGISDKQIK